MTISDVEIHRTTLAGVPALWSDVGGDFSGFLVVGVGARDLSPATVGLHHLVEHLIMHRVGPVRTEHNAVSTPDSITFWATGTPIRVADFLNRVAAAARSLADVTEDELALNRAVILTEVGPDGLYAARGPLSARWGAAGLGLADLNHAALMSLTADEVRAFVAEWFSAATCRLVLTGPPPQSLDAQLPPGRSPERPPHPLPLTMATPGIAYTEVGELTLSFLVDIDRELRPVVAEVLRETLFRRLRRDTGNVYSVQVMSYAIQDTTSSWTLLTDPATPPAALDVLRTAVGAVRELAVAGPDLDVLEHVQELVDADAAMQDARRAWLVAVAEAEVRGAPMPVSSTTRAVMAEEVRTSVASFVDSMLVTLPKPLVADPEAFDALEADLGLTMQWPLRSYNGMSRKEIMIDLAGGGVETGLARALMGSHGSSHKGKFFGPARGMEIWLGPRQLVLSELGAKIMAEDVVLVSEDDDGDVEVVTRTGAAVIVNPAHFRGAAAPWARLMGALPPHVFRTKRGLDVLAARTEVTAPPG